MNHKTPWKVNVDGDGAKSVKATVVQKLCRGLQYNYKTVSTRNSPKDEIPECDIALFCYPLLRLTPPSEGFSWDDLRKILQRGQRMAKVQNGKEILPKAPTPGIGRKNVSDDRRICDSKDPNVT